MQRALSKAIIKKTALNEKIMDVINGVTGIIKGKFTHRGKHFNYMIIPVEDRLKKRRSALLVMKDVTEMAAMEENLLHTEKLAAVGKFMAVAAHEINNPLSIVMGNIQYLLSNLRDVNAEEILKTANNEARRCADVIRNLLIFSRKPDL